MKRSAPLKRTSRLRPTGKFKMRTRRIRARNAKRRQSEFARCYGSKERVAFVKAQPCLVSIPVFLCFTHPVTGWLCPSRTPSDNAHTENGGKSRKADADTIVPLCRKHHQAFDQHRAPFDNESARAFVKEYAARVEAAWQRHQAGHV